MYITLSTPLVIVKMAKRFNGNFVTFIYKTTGCTVLGSDIVTDLSYL